MDAFQVPTEEAMGKCSWCGKVIPDDTPVFGFGGKKRPGADPDGHPKSPTCGHLKIPHQEHMPEA